MFSRLQYKSKLCREVGGLCIPSGDFNRCPNNIGDCWSIESRVWLTSYAGRFLGKIDLAIAIMFVALSAYSISREQPTDV